jgi:hypothetical protein
MPNNLAASHREAMSVFEEANVGFEIFVTQFVPTPEAISSNGLNARYI